MTTVSDLAGRVESTTGGLPCVIAVGGGADSAVLLAAAVDSDLAAVRAVFVDHGLEGSAELRRTVEDLSKFLSVTLSVVEAKVLDGPDLEARARSARYEAIDSVLGPEDVCCTAHTLDDQAETVLMRIARGSGATGLSGIPSARGRLRRPFLDVPRADLRTIAVERGLPFTDDPANTDDRFLRSRVRRDLVPVLEDVMGRDVREQLAMSAKLIAADDALLDWMARLIPSNTTIHAGHRLIRIPASALTAAPHPVASRAIRSVLRTFHDPYTGSRSDVAAVRDVAIDGIERTLSTDVVCAKEQGNIVLYRKHAFEPPAERVVQVPTDSVDTVPWGEYLFRVFVSGRPALASTSGRRSAVGADIEPGTLAFRAVAEGDRIDIEAGSTPVSEALRAAGVPARVRPFWLVITISGKIAAVHGIRVAPWARPVPGEPAIVIEREGPM